MVRKKRYISKSKEAIFDLQSSEGKKQIKILFTSFKHSYSWALPRVMFNNSEAVAGKQNALNLILAFNIFP